MEHLIRPYVPEDMAACRALWEQLTETHRRLYDDPTIGGDDPGRAFEAHLAAVGRERLWVAEEDGRVVGLAGLIDRGSKAELEPVVVDERARGRGIGRRLAEAAIAAARAEGAEQVVVRPVGRNWEAIRFFHRLGFDVLGRVDIRLDLAPRTDRSEGARLADRDFRL